MTKLFNVYIDEAGDEGFKVVEGNWVSSKWFIVGALIIPEEVDREIASTINEIKNKINFKNMLKPLHFCKLKHKKKKVVIQEIVNKGNFTVVITGVYKPELEKDGVLKHEKQFLYNYVTRYLLERISWFVDDRNRKSNLIFENRSNTSYDELDMYIKDVLKDPQCQIRPGSIYTWKALNKSQSKNLQVADSIVSAVYAAFEPDEFGNIETSYIFELIRYLYSRKGNTFSYGLKLFPLSGSNKLIQDKYPWLKSI